jgi:hypothetical protein
MINPAQEHAALAALKHEYEAYIKPIRSAWLAENRDRSNEVYEVMRPEDRERVHGIMARWEQHATVLTEAWWKERGYGVVWPDDNSKPMKVFRLDLA